MKLEERINALEDVVLEMGQEVANIKARLSTKCHVKFQYIRVTLLSYNSSLEEWNRTRAHLIGNNYRNKLQLLVNDIWIAGM